MKNKGAYRHWEQYSYENVLMKWAKVAKNRGQHTRAQKHANNCGGKV